jgi:uncharacterized protein (DUF305 family)
MKLRCAALIATCGLLLAGCVGQIPTVADRPAHKNGSQDASRLAPADPAADPAAGAPAAAQRNTTDVMFLQMMVPHHTQGLAMVRLAVDRAHRPEVRMLAAAIDTTQTAEVDRMSGWLTAWGAPAAADEHAHADHGGLPGTTPEEIAGLAATEGIEFDIRFLNLMIGHQDDAIQLARMELSAGVNRLARSLAGQIDQSRTAQIELMLGYLKQ